MSVEWHGRTAFAEVAEVLNVRTDEIMGCTKPGTRDYVLALYTTGTDDPETAVVHQALLFRDAHGVLRLDSSRTVAPLQEWARKMGLEGLAG